MWFKKLFRKKKQSEGNEQNKTSEEKEKAMINQGVYYLYLIVGVQVAVVLGLVGVITAFGTIIATPLWVFLGAMFLIGAGIVYTYRKIKEKFRKFTEAFQRVDLADRKYELSFMGGMLTMRVEQNSQRPMIEAPQPDNTTVIDAETIEVRKEASPH